MSIRAVIFDLDDTLYPEWSYVFSGFRAVASAFAPRLRPTFDLLHRMRELADSPDRRQVFHVVCAEAGISEPDACAAEMVQTYRTHAPSIALFPDAEAALKRCRGRFHLGLISDGFLAAQNAKIDALGIREGFDLILLTDQWGREFWKPHPQAFQATMEHFDLEPGVFVYVSDNPAKDFLAPNHLGWHTVRIRRPDGVYANEVAPPGGEPQHTISTLDELDGVLSAE